MSLSFFLQPLRALRRLYRHIMTDNIVKLMGYPVLVNNQLILVHFLVAEYLHSRFPRCRPTTLRTLRVHKRHSSPFHEFLVLELYDNSQQSTVGFLEMERYLDNTPLDLSSPGIRHPPAEGTQQSPVAETRPSTSTRSSGSRSTSSLLSRPLVSSMTVSTVPSTYSLHHALPALDQATVYDGPTLTHLTGEGPRASDELICISLEERNIPLGNVIAAWKVISEYREQYTPLKHQCFWFALLLFRLLVGGRLWDLNKETLYTKGQSNHMRQAGSLGLFEIVSQKHIEEDARHLEEKYSVQAEQFKNPRPYAQVGADLADRWLITEGAVSTKILGNRDQEEMQAEIDRLRARERELEASVDRANEERDQALRALAERDGAYAETGVGRADV